MKSSIILALASTISAAAVWQPPQGSFKLVAKAEQGSTEDTYNGKVVGIATAHSGSSNLRLALLSSNETTNAFGLSDGPNGTTLEYYSNSRQGLGVQVLTRLEQNFDLFTVAEEDKDAGFSFNDGGELEFKKNPHFHACPGEMNVIELRKWHSPDHGHDKRSGAWNDGGKGCSAVRLAKESLNRK